MGEERNKRGAGFWATMIVLGAMALPFLYLASLGPVAFLFEKGVIDMEVLAIAAHPLTVCAHFLDEKPDWFWKGVAAYLYWWAPSA